MSYMSYVLCGLAALFFGALAITGIVGLCGIMWMFWSQMYEDFSRWRRNR